MYTIVRNTSWFILLVPFVLLFANVAVDGDNFDNQTKALNFISDFASHICETIPQTGTSSNIELSGKAKAELSDLLKKIANLGIEGGVKYQDSKWEGVLQTELSEQLNRSRDCKLEVFNELKDRLLPVESVKTSLDISGTWRDPNNSTHVSHITQEGNSFQFDSQGVLPQGIQGISFTSTGSGTVIGQDIESSYTTTYQNGQTVDGKCTGFISRDGSRITSTCADDLLGTFSLSGVKQ